ncbi:MAG: glycosyltransferase family 39 protein [Bryobacterales bacterium]|nr:glycosyltransferase family 39 protein [Bryobacterales bacterium]
MDDVDSVQAVIARNMLRSGDWITPHINGIPYFEKPPFKYWLMATSFGLFGVHDWSARLPMALAAILLCFATARLARWAFDAKVGLYAGLVLSTCVGLFLFTRVMISDGLLSLSILLALWCFLCLMEPDEEKPRRWAIALGGCLGLGVLIKGLLALVIPVGAVGVYLLVTRELFRWDTWKRLHLPEMAGIALAVAAPWHVLASMANPPAFAISLEAGPGQYRGFFWFYFFNEHLLRFLNLRYPRDYNTVPRLQFWLYHLLWVFPWTAWLPGVVRLHFHNQNRAARTRLLCLCVIGFVLVFFTLSTTQEYYTMPAYAAFAILVGCALALEGRTEVIARKVTGAVFSIALAAVMFLLLRVWGIPVEGDIADALSSNPEAYTLALGHLEDLTLDAFAYLRPPLAMAGMAMMVGILGAFFSRGYRAALILGVAMVMFFAAARQAMVVFDPYLSTQPLAMALRGAPRGTLVLDDQYYAFSSVPYYADREALLLNGRVNNLEYGSYAPGAPDVFLDDVRFQERWRSEERHYLVIAGPNVDRVQSVAGQDRWYVVASSGGKFLITNRPFGAGSNDAGRRSR